MSKGKYSPALSTKAANRPYTAYCYNADRQIPPERPFFKTTDDDEEPIGRDIYDPRLHFANYDENGYDSYGYSAFDADGNYVGGGTGIDRWGYTEMDYLGMSDEEFEDACMYGA